MIDSKHLLVITLSVFGLIMLAGSLTFYFTFLEPQLRISVLRLLAPFLRLVDAHLMPVPSLLRCKQETLVIQPQG